jgi:hypothetical protein
VVWLVVPPHHAYTDLDSQKVEERLAIRVTSYKYDSVSFGVCTYNVFCGATTPTCGNAPLKKLAPCAYDYINVDWLLRTRGNVKTCDKLSTGDESDRPATCS